MKPSRVDTAIRTIAATPDAVYDAFTDPAALMAWLPPQGMTGRALTFEPEEGGRFRIELVYDDPAAAPGGAGKSGARSDISSGRFERLEPGRRIVQSIRFESDDPAFAGTMIMTWDFAPVAEGTAVSVSATQVPPGIAPEDHRAGLESSLANLARLVEAG